MKRIAVVMLAVLAASNLGFADVRVNSLFTSHMVLQRDQANRVWGWADAGEEVTVTIGDQTKTAMPGQGGRWEVVLAPLPVGGPLTMVIKGKNSITIEDILVGEVWICSGQSNMQWAVQQSNNADLEIMAAKYPKIRMISVPQVGTQEPQNDFKGSWAVCTPEVARDFSAVGYFFGRQLHQTLDVPIGLIDNAWGGSACEAWIRRDILQADAKYGALLARWENIEKTYDHEKAVATFKLQMEKWKTDSEAAKKEGKPIPPQPRGPNNPLTGNARPANIYNGVLKPTIGYGIRGAIWYQGESNASRAYQYRKLFPLMIQSWRDEWQQGNFPFYFVQLADFRDEKTEPGESDWAELREAQTMTLSALPNTGQAVIIDIGEGKDIHPKNKQDVGMRLARWALAKDYGVKIPFQSPTYKSMTTDGNRVILSFDSVGGGLRTFDVAQGKGFAVCGEDKAWKWAKAEIKSASEIVVSCPDVPKPVAVRYAWSDNPICNVFSAEGLPLTPFRTDDWPGVTANAE